MDQVYRDTDARDILSPALLVFRGPLLGNIAQMVEIAGDAGRLRPHCKTHKMPQVIGLELEQGIQRHKAATFAEAEMLVRAGARDIFLAYNMVGPNVGRAVRFCEQFPQVTFAVTADAEEPVRTLASAMQNAKQTINVLLDVDTGQHRTGVPCDERAEALYRLLAETEGLQAAGIHLYDGQNHQTDVEERRAAVMDCWRQVSDLRDRLADRSLEVPQIVAGGTGSFPIYATIEDASLQLSPGTCVFHDAGYGAMFPDLQFRPAAYLLTRVISRPTPQRVTLDLGYKAVASDPPMPQRVVFPDLPDAKLVLQNEEHLVIETDAAEQYRPGDVLWALPRHICPTSALHRDVYVVENGSVVDRWEVLARDRWLTI